MKNLKLFTLLFLGSIAFSSCLEMFGEGIEGSGNVISSTKSEIKGFTKVAVATGINATIKIGDKENVEIEADDNLMELVVVEVNGDELNIYMKENYHNAKKLNAYITATSLEAVKTSSAGRIVVEDNVEVETFSGNASSGGNIRLNGLSATNISFETSSAGNINVEAGTTTDLNIGVSSGGVINAFDLETQNCEARASSGGNARINVVKSLKAEASSGGNIRFKGNPTMNGINTSSGGNISQD